MRISADRAPAEQVPRDKAIASFRGEFWQFVYTSVFLTGKLKDSVVQKAHRAESIYVKTMGTACVSEELCQ